MNVRLAAQTLSKGVSCSLLFCEELKLLSGATAGFCEVLNNVFDLTNCRNKLGKGNYYCPINDEKINYIKDFLDHFKEYIEGLKYYDINSQQQGIQILKSTRKTGFLGLIICLTNLFKLFYVVKPYGMSYLLSYKISQDHIEVFFSAMRSRGGFNNNPNAIQFRSAYKRLLVRHEISGSAYGNCTLLDNSIILFVSANKRNNADALCHYNDDDESQYFKEFEHDYDYRTPQLDEYVNDVVKYTTRFIVYKIRKQKNICETCYKELTTEDMITASTLLKIKNKGKLINTSVEV